MIHRRLDVFLAPIIPGAEVCRYGLYLKLFQIASCCQIQSPWNLLGGGFWIHIAGFYSLKHGQQRIFRGEPVNFCF